MLFPLFGEFVLFFSYPFQHTSFTRIALPTPFEVNLFLGYFPSLYSFVSYSSRIVFFLPFSLSRFLLLSLSLSLSLSFFHRGVCGILLPQPGIDWSWALGRVLTTVVPGNSLCSFTLLSLFEFTHLLRVTTGWVSTYVDKLSSLRVASV